MRSFASHVLVVFLAATSPALTQEPSVPAQFAPAPATAPRLSFGNAAEHASLQHAYEAALRNVLEINTIPVPEAGPQAEYNQTGLLSASPATFIRAGAGYAQPWTRDASVNSWNAASLLEPAVGRNTLLSVLRRQPDGKLIVQQDDQWWDQVVWISAAWNHFLVTGDRIFLAQAYEAAQQTLLNDKQAHFNIQHGLFEGPAFLNDGIAGYPVPPADSLESHGSFVLKYPGSDKIMVLSTNCLYVSAYQGAALMAQALQRPETETTSLQASAATLSQRIREQLWLPEQGRFAYFLSPEGKLDPSQEGSGLAFSILFSIATPAQSAFILRSIHTDPHGLADTYPSFPRFSAEHPGRHNDILWPPIQAFWADAAAHLGDVAAFRSETQSLADLVTSNDGHFWEIYNAATGKPDGGWQVGHQWNSEQDQTWSATGYLRMIYAGLFGIRPEPTQLTFAPLLPDGWGPVTLTGLHYRDAVLTIELSGAGGTVRSVTLDGKPQPRATLPSNLRGTHTLQLVLGSPTLPAPASSTSTASANQPAP